MSKEILAGQSNRLLAFVDPPHDIGCKKREFHEMLHTALRDAFGLRDLRERFASLDLRKVSVCSGNVPEELLVTWACLTGDNQLRFDTALPMLKWRRDYQPPGVDRILRNVKFARDGFGGETDPDLTWLNDDAVNESEKQRTGSGAIGRRNRNYGGELVPEYRHRRRRTPGRNITDKFGGFHLPAHKAFNEGLEFRPGNRQPAMSFFPLFLINRFET